MSPAYGLAVDNLLEVDVVLANGNLVTANKCLNQDLFWALRGGGGGTYGIVTRAVHKAHDTFDNYLQMDATYMAEQPLCRAAGIDCKEIMVTTFLEFLDYVRLNQPGKWSGYALWAEVDG